MKFEKSVPRGLCCWSDCFFSQSNQFLIQNRSQLFNKKTNIYIRCRRQKLVWYWSYKLRLKLKFSLKFISQTFEQIFERIFDEIVRLGERIFDENKLISECFGSIQLCSFWCCAWFCRFSGWSRFDVDTVTVKFMHFFFTWIFSDLNRVENDETELFKDTKFELTANFDLSYRPKSLLSEYFKVWISYHEIHELSS